MNDLSFNWTKDIPTFKKHSGASSLNIVKNPNTGKLFFEATNDTSIRGAVAASWQDGEPVVSQVVTSDGEVFHILHKKGSGGTENLVATL